MILLIAAAWLLPPLDSRVKPHPAAVVLVVVGCAVGLILGCISLYRYFNHSWRSWRSVPNKTEYVVWLSLETLTAIGVGWRPFGAMHACDSSRYLTKNPDNAQNAADSTALCDRSFLDRSVEVVKPLVVATSVKFATIKFVFRCHDHVARVGLQVLNAYFKPLKHALRTDRSASE